MNFLHPAALHRGLDEMRYDARRNLRDKVKAHRAAVAAIPLQQIDQEATPAYRQGYRDACHGIAPAYAGVIGLIPGRDYTAGYEAALNAAKGGRQ